MKFNFFLNLAVLISIIFFNGKNLVFGANYKWFEVSKTPAGVKYLDRDSLNIINNVTIEITKIT